MYNNLDPYRNIRLRTDSSINHRGARGAGLKLIVFDRNLALNSDAAQHYEYSRTSITRTPIARLPWLIRTRF